MPDNSPVLWEARDVVRVPPTASVPEIASFARQLTPRESQQVVQAFENGAYEMASTFVWTKTMAGLKRQLATLGIEFIAEMLDRPDITSGSDVFEVLTDYDSVRLAEDLGMFGSSHALRLRHALETINHFSNRPEDADLDGMNPEEAIGSLRICVQTVLGHDQLNVAVEFAEFRRRLEAEVLPEEWLEGLHLEGVPYFFKRTIMRVVLAGIKSASGAQLENLLANLNSLLPHLWPLLMDADKFSVGRLYADLHSDGQSKAASGVRSALLKVAGFDFVPENLRSNTFIEAASRLLATHFDWDNFRAEPSPMRALASLGTSIPIPAFAKCMTAILAVRIGNRYGVSWAAQDDAKRMLDGVTADRWKYYLESCLPGDEVILQKLRDDEIAERWCELVQETPRLRNATTSEPTIETFLQKSEEGDVAKVERYAKRLLDRVRQ